MVNSLHNTFDYNGNTYKKRTYSEERAGVFLATTVSALLYAALPSFSNPFLKQMTKEHANNHLYRDSFIKAVEKSGLTEKGLTISHMDLASYERNLPKSKIPNYDVKMGLNAFFRPDTKEIALNLDKASISGFHELGHAMNNMSGKFGKILQKLRKPGYVIAGLMGTLAFSSRLRPKESRRDLNSWILDHCASIAVVGMLPTVLEEALASYNGIKMAKTVGLSEPLVKNLKKFYGKALLSYAGYAAVTGLSVYAISKIMEVFTRPKKITTNYERYSFS